jgi:hypothetical protein
MQGKKDMNPIKLERVWVPSKCLLSYYLLQELDAQTIFKLWNVELGG